MIKWEKFGGGMIVMALCPKCGEMNKDGIKYCSYCGAELPKLEKKKTEEKAQFVYCPECGEKNPGGINNCKFCGATLDNYEYYNRKNAAEKKQSIREQLDTKRLIIFIIAVIISYSACYFLIAIFPPLMLACIFLGWKWTGSNIPVFINVTSDFFWGWLTGRAIASFFVGILIGPFLIVKYIMNVV